MLGGARKALLRDRGNESLRRRLSEGAPPRGAQAGDGFIVGGSSSRAETWLASALSVAKSGGKEVSHIEKNSDVLFCPLSALLEGLLDFGGGLDLLDFSECRVPNQASWRGGLGPWACQKVQPTLCTRVVIGLLKRSIPVRWGGSILNRNCHATGNTNKRA